jgi:hypothetical protein
MHIPELDLEFVSEFRQRPITPGRGQRYLRLEGSTQRSPFSGHHLVLG